MPESKQAPLRRLLNRRDTTSLLVEFEVLLPGYYLSIFGEDGQILGGNPDYAPESLNVLLAKAHDGQMIEWEDNLIQPLVFEAQIKGAIVAHRIKHDAESVSNLEAHQVLACLNHTLSLLLAKAIETRDVVDETVDRYREINLLYQIGETIGTCLNPQKIPQLVLREANRCIQVEAALVLLASNNSSDSIEKNSNLEVKASNGRTDQVEALQRLAKQIVDQVIESRRPAITINPYSAQHHEDANGLFAAILCVPLLVGERVLGAIVLGRLSYQKIFTAGERKLLMALASQASIALETVRLHLEEIKKQRLEEELAITRKIQLSLLPETLPTASGWEFAAVYQAAHQVGGDLYDFLQLPEQPGKFGLVIADVAGKGIPAALFMAFCRTIIRMQAMTGVTPAHVLERTNRLILQDSRSDLFLTVFYAQLNPQNGEMVYANGGHDPPVWFRAVKGDCQELISRSYLLGLFSKIHPEERQIQIAPGDLLVFYTDGITEARNSKGEFFGEERLQSSIMANKESSAQDVLQKILVATNEFIGDSHQSDDFTLFVIKRKKEGR